MFEYLNKFNELPEAVRLSVTGDDAMVILTELEQKYGVDLAAAVMRVMVGEIPLIDLPKFFIFDFNLDGVVAQQLTDELTDRIFSRAADYLGIGVEKGMPVDQVEIEPEEDRMPRVQARGSAFFFSPEDEEEVRTLAQKLDTKKGLEKEKTEIEDKLDKILVEAKVGLSSEILVGRFINAVRTYLREVRNKIETKDTLMKPAHVGGLGLDEATVDRIMAIADKYKNMKQAAVVPPPPPPKMKVPEDDHISIMKGVGAIDDGAVESATKPAADMEKKKNIIRDVDYDFNAAARKKAAEADKAEPLDTGHEIAPPPPVVPKPAGAGKPAPIAAAEKPVAGGISGPGADKIPAPYPSAPTPTPGPAGPSVDIGAKPGVISETGTFPAADKAGQGQPEPMAIKTSPMAPGSIGSRRSELSGGKVRIEDVKHVPRLEGPVDELKNMDLVNFRRLSRSPQEAARKIKEKIIYLEEEKYSKRIEGIRAWRTSPLNKLYLQIGQDSIAGKKSVEEILKARVTGGGEFLTTDEFEAIMALNKELRF